MTRRSLESPRYCNVLRHLLALPTTHEFCIYCFYLTWFFFKFFPSKPIVYQVTYVCISWFPYLMALSLVCAHGKPLYDPGLHSVHVARVVRSCLSFTMYVFVSTHLLSLYKHFRLFFCLVKRKCSHLFPVWEH